MLQFLIAFFIFFNAYFSVSDCTDSHSSADIFCSYSQDCYKNGSEAHENEEESHCVAHCPHQSYFYLDNSVVKGKSVAAILHVSYKFDYISPDIAIRKRPPLAV